VESLELGSCFHLVSPTVGQKPQKEMMLRHGFLHVRDSSGSPTRSPTGRRSVSAEPRPPTDEEELAFARYVATFHFSKEEMRRPTKGQPALTGWSRTSSEPWTQPLSGLSRTSSEPWSQDSSSQGSCGGMESLIPGPRGTAAPPYTAEPPPVISRLRADAPAFVPQATPAPVATPAMTFWTPRVEAPIKAETPSTPSPSKATRRLLGPPPTTPPPLPPVEATDPTPPWSSQPEPANTPSPLQASSANLRQFEPSQQRRRWGDLIDDTAPPQASSPSPPPTEQASQWKAAATTPRRRLDWEDVEDDDDETYYRGAASEAQSEDQVEHASLASHDSGSTTAPPSGEEALAPPQPSSPCRSPATTGLQERPVGGRKHISIGGSAGDRSSNRRHQRSGDDFWEQTQANRNQKKSPSSNKGQANLVWRPKGQPAAAKPAGVVPEWA